MNNARVRRSAIIGIGISLVVIGTQSAKASIIADVGGVIGGGVGAALGSMVGGTFGSGAGGAAGVYAGQTLAPIVADHPAISSQVVINLVTAGAPAIGQFLGRELDNLISWLW